MEQQLGGDAWLAADRTDVRRRMASLGPDWSLACALLPILGLLMLAGGRVDRAADRPFCSCPRSCSPTSRGSARSPGLQRIFSLHGTVRLGFGLFKVLHRRGRRVLRPCDNRWDEVLCASDAGALPTWRLPGRHLALDAPVGRRRAVDPGAARLRLPALEARAGPADDAPGNPRGDEEPAGRSADHRPPPGDPAADGHATASTTRCPRPTWSSPIRPSWPWRFNTTR